MAIANIVKLRVAGMEDVYIKHTQNLPNIQNMSLKISTYVATDGRTVSEAIAQDTLES